jgi:hypothetical protein
VKRVLIAAAVASVLLGASPSPAAAEANVRLDTGSAEVSNMLAQGCDEYIRFAGTVRFVFVHVSWGIDTFLSNVRIVDANLVGVGETSGTTYRLVEILGGTAMEREDQVVSATEEVTLKVFGGGQIYSFKLLYHLTVALNGEVTANFEDLRQDGCSA